MGHDELQWLKSRFHLKEIRYPQEQRYHSFGNITGPINGPNCKILEMSICNTEQ